MILFLSGFSVIILLSIFYKIEWGVGFLMLYLFLVPTYSLVFGTFSIGQNVFFLLLLLMLLLNKRGIKNNYLSMIIPFVMLFVTQAVLIPFHFSDMPFEDQLSNFRVDLMSLLLPYAIICMALSNRNSSTLYVNLLYIAIAVSSLYTIFLLSMLGQNPYIDSIENLLKSYDDSGQERVLEEGVRLFGYISSVYVRATEYGVFLIFSSVFLIRQFSRDNTWIPRVLYGLVLVCIFVCGVRSALMAEGVVVLAFLLQQRRFKVFGAAAVVIVILGFLINTFLPDYLQFIMSIRGDSVAGSSLDMREEQLMGCIESLQNNPLLGHGYGWTSWYLRTIGHHTTMLSFESCIIQILCNNGIMGLVIWSSFVVVLLRKIKKIISGNKSFYQSIVLLLVGYFSYTFFTGDYGAFRVMMIFFAIFIANEISLSRFALDRRQQVSQKII